LKKAHDVKLRGKSSDVKPMDYEHFVEMERRIFQNLKFSPKLIETLMPLVVMQKQTVESKIEVPKNSVINIFSQISDKIKKEDKTVVKINLCAAITLLANYSVLWTTRDWGATGTLSCLASVHMTLFQER
jgi:hypothetical protein